MDIRLHGSTDKAAVIDRVDYSLVARHKWYLANGYAVSTRHRRGKSRTDKDRNQNIAMHRLLMGEPPMQGMFVDHIDRDRLNNRRSNLRWVTAQQNAQNVSPYGEVKGVKKDGGKWSARIRRLHLGSYQSKKQAGLAYDKAARHFFGEYAYLNYPDEKADFEVRYVDFVPDQKKLTSDYVGVSYFGHGGKRKKRWRAVFRKKTIGYYHTEEEAAEAYRESKESYEDQCSRASSCI